MALGRGPRRVVDLEEAGDGLLLQPLLRVPGRHPGERGDLRHGAGRLVLQGGVEAELVAERDTQHLEGAVGRAEDPLGELVGLHVFSFVVAGRLPGRDDHAGPGR